MVPCPLCGQHVDWVTMNQAADLLKVSPTRVRQFIKDGRLPGAHKVHPGNGISSLWQVPIASVVHLAAARKES